MVILQNFEKITDIVITFQVDYIKILKKEFHMITKFTYVVLLIYITTSIS